MPLFTFQFELELPIPITTYYWIDIEAFKSVLNRIDIELNCDLKNLKIVRFLTIHNNTILQTTEQLLSGSGFILSNPLQNCGNFMICRPEQVRNRLGDGQYE